MAVRLLCVGLPDWSAAKVRLVMWAAALPFMVGYVIWGYWDERASETDCTHADQAMRQWALVIAQMNAAPIGLDGVPDLERDASAAADAIRGEATSIEDSELQIQLRTLADDMDKVSRGTASNPPDGLSALHEMQVACPDIGDDPTEDR